MQSLSKLQGDFLQWGNWYTNFYGLQEAMDSNNKKNLEIEEQS